jgi:hypothetical protein
MSSFWCALEFRGERVGLTRKEAGVAAYRQHIASEVQPVPRVRFDRRENPGSFSRPDPATISPAMRLDRLLHTPTCTRPAASVRLNRLAGISTLSLPQPNHHRVMPGPAPMWSPTPHTATGSKP